MLRGEFRPSSACCAFCCHSIRMSRSWSNLTADEAKPRPCMCPENLTHAHSGLAL
jgi:hypothetical protein